MQRIHIPTFILTQIGRASQTHRRKSTRSYTTSSNANGHGLTQIQNPLPATFLRGGTSKGIFINKSVLPSSPSQWGPIFLGIMGSPDPEHGRQLNGMGGGISSLSKICVVGEPTPTQRREGIQVEYTFIQVGIRDNSIDYSGNCGNLSSMIGVYAVDEGICTPSAGLNGTTTVRSFNTNTQKIIDTTFPISAGGQPILDLPQTSIAGVPNRASQIILDFINPAGARTGKLLPTNNPTDTLEIPSIFPSHPRLPPKMSIPASLVDATNPTIFVTLKSLAKAGLHMIAYIAHYPAATEDVSLVLEAIRQEGARRMGLDPQAQAQPKIALLCDPNSESEGEDIQIHTLSMGVLHKAVPMTVGLCLGVAAKTPGTIPWEIMRSSRGARDDLIRIRHPGGLVDVGAEFDEDGSVKSARVVRTGRRLMKGVVWW